MYKTAISAISLTLTHTQQRLNRYIKHDKTKKYIFRLEERKSEWVEEVSRCIVDSFQLGENTEGDMVV